MGCLSISVTPMPQAQLVSQPCEQARLSLKDHASEDPRPTTVLRVNPQEQPRLSASPIQQAILTVSPMQHASLIIGETCCVGTEEIMVLAGTDGPLRNRDGGYLLLNPANEQDN